MYVLCTPAGEPVEEITGKTIAKVWSNADDHIDNEPEYKCPKAMKAIPKVKGEYADWFSLDQKAAKKAGWTVQKAKVVLA